MKESVRRVGAPRAWVAVGHASNDGRQATSGDRPALVVFAVSVNDSFSTSIDDRLRLMEDVAERFVSKVPQGVPTLWVLPGGYFGYDPASGTFKVLDANTLHHIEHGISDLAHRLPTPNLVAVGVDNCAAQRACIAEHHQGNISVSYVTRERTDLAARQFKIGPVRAAFFICGEFTGSRTAKNGPFCEDGEGRACYLQDPVRQLHQCDVLVDLAHLRVSGSVSGVCGPRMVHRRQMERFSAKGVAVLTHHHSDLVTGGRPHFKHQSNWIVFKGGKWLPESAVTPLS
jgi:hypothetical protein